MDIDGALGRALPRLRRSTSPVDRIAYARDLWPRHHLAVRAGAIAENQPGVVVWPESTAEVAEVVRFCAGEGIALVPFGAGSGVCGGVLPNPRTVIVDVKRLGRTRRADPERGELEVEAGAMGIRLEEELAATGRTLGHFPSSILCSTVGGWVAARSAGQCSGRYGKIEDMVASLECVTGTGEVVNLSRRTHGPDLTPLVVGSEGILALVTAATLRTHALPAVRAFGSFAFPSIEAGWSAMREMFQAGLRPAVARLYDPFDSMIARRGKVRTGGHEKRAEPRGPGAGGAALRTILRAPGALNGLIDAMGSRVFGGSMLVLIFEGEGRDPSDDLARGHEIAGRLRGKSLGEEPARRWLAHRYGVSYRQAPTFMAGAFSDTMEVAAPWSRLRALYDDVRHALGSHVFVMAHLSHAYPDGCSIYFTFAGAAPNREQAEATYDAAWRAALDAAVRAGGTLSHHHGVGRSKAPKLGAEIGLGVDVVRAIKRRLDPSAIFNPGNLLPEGPTSRARRTAAAPAAPVLDRTSQLVEAAGTATLGAIEAALAPAGLSLALSSDAPGLDTPLARWIATGARGAPDPWLDPVDHLVAGFSARLDSGGELAIAPGPRRAVGPDLFAILLGAEERAGVLTSAVLRAHGRERARSMLTGIERDPPVSDAEKTLIAEVLTAAGSVA